MFISVTKLRLHSITKLPKFFKMVRAIQKQLQTPEGLISKQTKGVSFTTFYTITTWESKEHMLTFRNNGAHLEAMKKINTVGKKASYTNYESDTIPGWKEALKKLKESEIKTI